MMQQEQQVSQFNQFIQQVVENVYLKVKKNTFYHQQSSQTVFDIFQLITEGDHHTQQKIRQFWLYDYNLDPLSDATIDLICDQKLDFIKNCEIQNGAFLEFIPTLIANQPQQLQSLSRQFQVQYNQQQPMLNDANSSNIQNYRFMTNLLSIELQDDQQDIMLLIRGELEDVDLQIMSSQQNRSFISVISAMKFAGVSTSEFIKSAFIIYVISKVVRDLVSINNNIHRYIIRNFVWLSIYYAQLMQHLDNETYMNAQYGTHFFQRSVENNYSRRQITEIENQLEHFNYVSQMNGLQLVLGEVFAVRSPFQRVFQIARQFDLNMNIFQKSDQYSLNQERALVAIQDNQAQQQLQNQNDLSNTEIIALGIKGIFSQIVAAAYMTKMDPYFRSVMEDDLLWMNHQWTKIFISVVFQVPVVISELPGYSQLDELYRFNDIIQNPADNIQNLIKDQYTDNNGYSEYFTISFTRTLNSARDLSDDLEGVDAYIREQIAQQLQDLMFDYNGEQLNQISFRANVLQNCFENAMVKQITIKPVSYYGNQITSAQTVQHRRYINNQTTQRRPLNFQQTYTQNQQISRPIEIRKSQRARNQSARVDASEYESKIIKRQYKGIFTYRDRRMEELFNDIDLQDNNQDCCQRAANNILKLSSINQIIECKNMQQLLSIVQQIEYIDEKRYVKSCKYNQINSEFITDLYFNETTPAHMLYIGNDHVFIGSTYHLIEHGNKLNIIKKANQDIKPNKIIRHNKNKVKQILKNVTIKYRKKQLSYAKYLLNKHRMCVYFDFETTYDDVYGSIQNKGVKQRQGMKSYEQIEFAYSLIVDMKIKFRDIINNLYTELTCKEDYPIQFVSMNYIEYQEESLWELSCAQNLIQRILSIQAKLHHYIDLYQQDLRYIQDLYADLDIDQFQITSSIMVYSYNGAKFDNHFILSGVKNIHKKLWYQEITYMGSPADMKVMKYKDINFCDLKLMTAGQSLKQFCKDMQLDTEHSKKEFDMNKMKYYSQALKHKDEIMEYVMYDSISMRQIHRKFEKSVRQIIQHFIQSEHGAFKDACDLDISQGFKESNKNISYYKLLAGYMRQWFTISSLSVKIFNDFFLDHTLHSPEDEDVYQMMQNSYQGGYTQAFAIGECDELVYYLDYNSMYPSIMASCEMPTDLNKAEIYEVNARFENSIDILKLGIQATNDALRKDSQDTFKLQNIQGHYNLYEISEFKFKNTCTAPQFGLRTKMHGTVYPLYYNYENSKQHIINPLVVFGFQISQAFYEGVIEYIVVKQMLQIDSKAQCNIKPIFKKFDTFMYNSRLQYKKDKNASMAQCVKIFINSLYGKYGERHHDSDIIMDIVNFNDDVKFKQTVNEHILQLKNVKQFEDYFDKIEVRNIPMYDLNNRDMELIRINVKNIPYQNKHIGAFVYYASLITAIGRTQITQIANQMTSPSKVLYIDTDSIVVNEAGFDQIQKQKLVNIHESALGAMKNEYPLDNYQLKTSISRFVIFNKKVYQYMIGQKWTNKFKGCRNVNDDMKEQFMSGTARYVQAQQRFKKQNGNVTICEFDMTFKLRLSRTVTQSGQFALTDPYYSLEELKKDYGSSSAFIYFNDRQNSWIVNSD